MNKFLIFFRSNTFSNIFIFFFLIIIGASVSEWIFNKTRFIYTTFSLICIVGFILFSIIKVFDPLEKSKRKMKRQKNVYEKLKIFQTEILPITQKQLPKTIYKFISLSEENKIDNHNKLSSLENNQIWFSRIDKLNDPFDGYSCCYLKDFIDPEKYENINEFIEAWNKYLNKLRQELYSTSFTKCINNFPMWAHYTNNFSGFCLEFEVVDSSKLFEVKYSVRKFDVASIIDQIITEYYFDLIQNEQFELILKIFHLYLCSIKSNQWSYEQEVRSVFYRPNCFANGQLMNIEDIGLKIKKIYVGCNASKENLEHLDSIAKKLGVSIISVKPDFTSEFFNIKC